MELLSPAGNTEKLTYSYLYGADAAYIGLPHFSLRARADNIDDNLPQSPDELARIKGTKKLYAAVNMYFHNPDLGLLREKIQRIGEYPFDAFILSDVGALALFQKYLTNREYHLSTQANCTNWAAAKAYHSMGFSRIVPGRELTLQEIAEIKIHVPELEIEAFAHGAMCMSYSGRCFLSSETVGRSANKGDCAHNCRWTYNLALEEESRPGQYIPVEQGQAGTRAYTALLSSKDLCMIDHLQAMKDSGVDSIKIEGRMKSLYYVALVTRAYRWGIDHLDSPGEVTAANPYREDLFEVSHREYGTGFYFDFQARNIGGTEVGYHRSHLFMASIGSEPPLPVPADLDAHTWTPLYPIGIKNSFTPEQNLEILGPKTPAQPLVPGSYRLYTPDGQETTRLTSEMGGWICFTRASWTVYLGTGWLIRKEL